MYLNPCISHRMNTYIKDLHRAHIKHTHFFATYEKINEISFFVILCYARGVWVLWEGSVVSPINICFPCILLVSFERQIYAIILCVIISCLHTGSELIL